MSVQHDEAIVTAAQVVHDQVWHRHWREGHTQLKSSQVVKYVRDVRVKAECTEERLPEELSKLLAEAREGTSDKKMMSLERLLVPLNRIIRPSAE